YWRDSPRTSSAQSYAPGCGGHSDPFGRDSAKYHRLLPVQEHAVLEVIFHRPRQCLALDVAAERDQIIDAHLVIDARDFLLDDRSFVELRRHVMRGRADQLHAALVRLMVRLGAAKARQERVMDVDRAPFELAT